MPIIAKLLLGLLSLAAVTGGLGIFAYSSISTVGAIAMDTYDKPLMAINFARASATDFAKIELATHHLYDPETGEPSADAQADETALEDVEYLLEDIADNIEVAAERALTAESRSLAEAAAASIEDFVGQTEALIAAEAVDPSAYTAL